MQPVTSWGRLSRDEHHALPLSDPGSVADALKSAEGAAIAYGMGRSYGDVCLNRDGPLWMTAGLNRFIDFDAETGRLTCEAGVLLRDIQQTFFPKGWCLPVTPGTQFVTVGGAIANDVHGKNHHVMGSFGEHVHRIELVRTDGTVIACGPDEEPAWFAATVGGLGLTGVISTAQ
ncbi:MAG: FAD-binding oxidoreductase, partial [Pseudomonadota bacterium]